MPPVKAIGMAAAKWQRNAAMAGDSYTEGVRAPRTPQADAAAAANDTWKAGVQQAVTRDAFVKGVREAGTDKWQRMSIEKGVARYPQGVQVSQPVYQAKAAKFFDVIQSTTLPPKGPKGDPRNIERVRAMATALRNAKVGGR